MLSLAFDCGFDDLYSHQGLLKIDGAFQAFLKDSNPGLFDRYFEYRSKGTDPETTDIYGELAPYVEDFIAFLFNIKEEVLTLQSRHHDLAPLFAVKRQFIQRHVLRAYKADCLEGTGGDHLRDQLRSLLGGDFTPLIYARAVLQWSQESEGFSKELDVAAKYAFWATSTSEGKRYHKEDPLFHVPQKLSLENLVPWEKDGNSLKGQNEHRRCRDGFGLTDSGISREKAIDQASYCIWCHHQGKDSCSKGLKGKTPEDRFQTSSLGSLLMGCPLEEKISEMNEARSQGYVIGALAIITIDNPLVAATGHRICNDCVKACIYQKQDPVDIPGIESQTLKEVLQLPWGFEIYSLLTRWNPLNFKRPLPLEPTGYAVLVVGMGPAGFNLSHHLLNEGHRVVGIDGLKIEPLGIPFSPIRMIEDYQSPLDIRINGGFGGVAEYGITVRWDKNNLTLIRLLLERRNQFSLFGGVRFGGTLTRDQAYDAGFDHIALCMGAGSPTLIPLKNGLAKGVRQASDFLMALQLTGAAKRESLANLEVELPALVIGGGLTAIDTATEVMAYYPLQVEKIHHRYQVLLEKDPLVRETWSKEEQERLDRFLEHGQAIIHERALAKREGRPPDFASLLHQWGGVHVVYRRKMIESPSYTLNHEEIKKALEEGIGIIEKATPVEVLVDPFGQACGLKISFEREEERVERILPARSLFIAAGTKPNINLIHDDSTLSVNKGAFQARSQEGDIVIPDKMAKPRSVDVLMDPTPGRGLSFFGDMHPSFAGNVVKAMASAKLGYPFITQQLQKAPPKGLLGEELGEKLTARVVAVNRLTPKILELVVRAPLAAQNFQPGQFYRLQNFETFAPLVMGTRLVMEGIALTGACVDKQKGTLSLIILEMGGSSNLCAHLKPNDPVVLMGPTGAPTEIPTQETVLLAGGGLGNAVLFSIGQAMREKGCKVIYFAGYKTLEDRYKQSDIEAAADQVIWCCDEAPGFVPSRDQDLSYHGNIVSAMEAYALGTIPGMETPGDLSSVQRLLVIGSDRMMAAVAQARQGVLSTHLNPDHVAIGSINSPMQCMMKEICAQCLQKQRDPVTGEERIVYSCVNQDQLLDWVDFKSLHDRLGQNSVQEKLTALWLRTIDSSTENLA